MKINYPDVLKKYLNSGFIGFSVIMATFNYIMLHFSFNRLSTLPEYDLKTMIEEFN